MNGRYHAALAAAALVGVVCVGGAAGHSSKAAVVGTKKLVIYSVPTAEQFMNHQDDRARGLGNNPFGNFQDAQTPTKEAGTGPFAGDRAIFTFALYTDASLKKSVGSAIYICQYSFNKYALCETAYVLSGGTLVGDGSFNFNATTFAVAVTGGTGRFRSMTGDVEATPAKKHAQHLAFTLD